MTKSNIKILTPLIITTCLLVAIVTSAFISVDIESDSIFLEAQEELNNSLNYHFFVSMYHSFNFFSFPLEELNSTKIEIEGKIEASLEENIISGSWISHRAVAVKFPDLSTTTLRNFGSTYPISELKIDQLRKFWINGSSFPQTANEVILAIEEDQVTNYHLNSLYNITSNLKSNNSYFEVNVTGIIPIKSLYDFTTRSAYYKYITTLSVLLNTHAELGFAVFVNNLYYKDFVRDVGNTTGENIEDFTFSSSVNYYFRINSFLLKSHKVSPYILKLKDLEKTLEKQYYRCDAYTDVISILHHGYLGKKGFSIFTNFLFSIPLLSVILLLQNSGRKLYEDEKGKTLKLLMERGLLTTHLFLQTLVEIFIACFSGLLLGIFLGYSILFPINSFDNSKIGFEYAFRIDILLIGIFFCIYGFRRVISYFIFGLKKSKTPLSSRDLMREKSDRNFLSTQSFIFGFFSFLILQLIELNRDIFLLAFPLMYYQTARNLLSLSTVLFFTYGLLKLIKTVFITGSHVISTKTWSGIYRKSLTISLKNIFRLRHFYSNIWMLIIILSLYSITLMLFVSSSETTFILQAEYTNYSDYQVQYYKSNENALFSYIQHNLSSVQSFTPVSTTSYTYKYSSDEEIGHSVKILGINSTSFFDYSVQYHKLYLTPSLLEIKQRFKEENTSVLANKAFLEQNGLKIGDSYSLYKITNITVVGFYSIAPVIGTSLSEPSIIISKDHIDRIQEFNLKHYCLVNTQGKLPQDNLEFLTESLETSIVSFEDVLSDITNKNSLWSSLKTIIATNIFNSMLIGALGVITFSYFNLNRRIHERGIDRALGLKRSENLKNSVLEESMVVLSAIIFGIITGIFFSIIFAKTFFSLLYYDFYYFGLVIDIPFLDIFQFSIFLLLVILISTVPYIYFQQKQPISSLLKRIDY